MIHGAKPGYRALQVAVKKVCVIRGRGVCIHAEQSGGKGSDINLANDEEEGLSATRREKGVFGLNFSTPAVFELLLAGH